MSEVVCEFRAGDLSLDDAPQSGRPAKVGSDQIETFIENNQHYTVQEIADTLKMSKSIKLLVKMKNVSFILWEKKIRTFWPTQYNLTSKRTESSSWQRNETEKEARGPLEPKVAVTGMRHELNGIARRLDVAERRPLENRPTGRRPSGERRGAWERRSEPRGTAAGRLPQRARNKHLKKK